MPAKMVSWKKTISKLKNKQKLEKYIFYRRIVTDLRKLYFVWLQKDIMRKNLLSQHVLLEQKWSLQGQKWKRKNVKMLKTVFSEQKSKQLG